VFLVNSFQEFRA